MRRLSSERRPAGSSRKSAHEDPRRRPSMRPSALPARTFSLSVSVCVCGLCAIWLRSAALPLAQAARQQVAPAEPLRALAAILILGIKSWRRRRCDRRHLYRSLLRRTTTTIITPASATTSKTNSVATFEDSTDAMRDTSCLASKVPSEDLLACLLRMDERRVSCSKLARRTQIMTTCNLRADDVNKSEVDAVE